MPEATLEAGAALPRPLGRGSRRCCCCCCSYSFFSGTSRAGKQIEVQDQTQERVVELLGGDETALAHSADRTRDFSHSASPERPKSLAEPGPSCGGAHRAQSVTWQSLGLQLGLRLPRPLRLESARLARTYLAGPACVLDANGPAPPTLPDRSPVFTTRAARLCHALLPAASAAVVPKCRARAAQAPSPGPERLAWQSLG